MLTKNRGGRPKEQSMGKRKKNEPKIATFHVAINGLRGREWAKADFK